MTWILFVVYLGHSVDHIEFPTQSECVSAQRQVEAIPGGGVRAVCLFRSR